VARTVGALNLDTGEVYRDRGEVRFRRSGDLTGEVGGFVPDVARLDLQPGRYRLEVQVQDLDTGKRGRYRQTIEVSAYPQDRLRMSDLELAWRITEDAREDVFSKGGLRVVPMPGRTYGKGQSVYVYYEVYNLQRDEFGQTHYRVSYSVGKKGKSSAAHIARLLRLAVGGGEEVAVTYEQRGAAATQVEHVALDLGGVQAGPQVLQVSVTDLNSGGAAEREAAFAIK
jgi:hypothetical protein